jgi:hypothetical protein
MLCAVCVTCTAAGMSASFSLASAMPTATSSMYLERFSFSTSAHSAARCSSPSLSRTYPRVALAVGVVKLARSGAPENRAMPDTTAMRCELVPVTWATFFRNGVIFLSDESRFLSSASDVPVFSLFLDSSDNRSSMVLHSTPPTLKGAAQLVDMVVSSDIVAPHTEVRVVQPRDHSMT